MRHWLGVLCSLASAQILLAGHARAADCVSDTMANYLNLNMANPAGCTVEDKIFRKFFYDSKVLINGMPRTDPITGMVLLLPAPGDVNVAPIKAINPPPPSYNPGLEFSSLTWSIGPNDPNVSIQSTIDFIVVVPNGDPLIDDASLLLRGNATNGGVITDQETVLFSTGDPATAKTVVMTATCNGVTVLCMMQNLSMEATATVPVQVVEVDDKITLSCNANVNCTANISGIEKRFSEVRPAIPEPTTWSLLVIGAGMLLVRGSALRRRAGR